MRTLLHLVLVAVLALGAASSHALDAATARAIARGDTDERLAATRAALRQPDAALARLLQALIDDRVKLAGDRVLIVGDAGHAADAVTGAAAELPADAEDATAHNRLRREWAAALATLQLFAPDAATRARAIQGLTAQAGGDVATLLPLVRQAQAQEQAPALQRLLVHTRAALELASPRADERLAAARTLADDPSPATLNRLRARLQPGAEPDPGVRSTLQASLHAVERQLAWGERIGVLFAGISLGSILLLAALGLAITYGLMGVINMAHGELMMVGAYATWGVQELVRQHAPALFDAYLWAAVPASFAAAAAVGAAMERLVIRHLYARPLETLLATWGISLLLMQTVRSLFGAQNVPVENPAWLAGGLAVLPNLVLPYNRLAIIAFAALVLLGMVLVIRRTGLGLFVRGVTQNRAMASCVGVPTARVDTAAFALGSGLAGLAGCALAQVGNVGPDLGQTYIVDSFMVVVLGGVGQIAGTVVAALGLGVANKLLEGVAGAVLAKIVVLVFIVAFIQKRPQGLFALKGRSAEA